MNDRKFTHRSPFAPMLPAGPLPPAVSVDTVVRAYRSRRGDLKPAKVLQGMGLKALLGLQAHAQLRKAVDSPRARAGDDRRVPPLYLALYSLLTTKAWARDAYDAVIMPSEVLKEDNLTYLSPRTFREQVTDAYDQLRPVEGVGRETREEALALFVLSYGLFQPDDAEELVSTLVSLGRGFADWFGVPRQVGEGTDVVDVSETPELPDGPARSGVASADQALANVERLLGEAAVALRSLAEAYDRGEFIDDPQQNLEPTLDAVERSREVLLADIGPIESGTSRPTTVSEARALLAKRRDALGHVEAATLILDQASSLQHRAATPSAILTGFQEHLSRLTESLHTDGELAARIAGGQHEASALLRLVQDLDVLADEDLANLKSEVQAAFGADIARAASRGALVIAPPSGAPDTRSDARVSGGELIAGPEHVDLPPPALAQTEEAAPDVADGVPVQMSNEQASPLDYVPGELAPQPALAETADGGAPLPPELPGFSVEGPVAPEFLASEQTTGTDDPSDQAGLPAAEAAVSEPDEPVLGQPVTSEEISERIWRLVAEDRSALAWHVVRAIEAGGASSKPPVPSAVLGLLVLGPHVRSSAAPPMDALLPCLDAIHGDVPELMEEHDEVAVATQLLLAAALLRPALLASHSGAPSLLESLTIGGASFRELSQFLSRVAQRPQELTPSLLKGIREIVGWEQELSKLTDRCREWLQHDRKANIIYAPTTMIWQQWLAAEGPLGRAFEAVSLGSDAASVEVTRAIEQWSDASNIEDQLVRTDKLLRGRKAELRPIEARAKTVLVKRVGTALTLLREWLQFNQARPAGGDQSLQKFAQELRQTVLPLLPRVKAELHHAAAKVSTSAVRRALVHVIDGALDDTTCLFDPAIANTAELPDMRVATNLELLSAAGLRLGSDWLPANGYTADVLAHLERLADRPRTSLVDAFSNRRDEGDHDATGWIIEAMERLGEETAGPLRSMREQDVSLAQAGLLAKAKRVAADINRAASYDLLTESLHLELTSRVHAVQRSPSCCFVESHASLDGILRQIDERKQERILQVSQRLQELTGAPQEAVNRVQQTLDAGNFLAANEYIDLLRERREIPEPSVENVIETFFPSFVKNAQTVSRLDKPELINAVRKGRNVGPIEMQGVRAAQAIEAADMLEAWYGAKGRLGIGRLAEQLKVLFEAFGFSDVQVSGKADAGDERRWRGAVKATPLGDRNVCVVPQFGSMAKGRYRIVCLWDRPSEEEILSVTAGEMQGALIVLYFGVLSVEGRRQLAHLCRMRRRSMLVVDEAVVLFTAGARGLRLPLLFQATLPFTVADPYVTTAGLLPPEMFFGRAAEKESVISPLGTNLIYGGRQLGKTALLRDVERSYHRPDVGVVVAWVDLRAEHIGITRPIDDIWGLLADLLRSNGVIAKDIRDPETLVAAVRGWIEANDDRRIVLLLDEADAFLDSDGQEHFRNVNRMKNLMDATAKRFKVVFAGLHNVQRASRAVNTPLAHLGEPICIGPLLNDKGAREALSIITKPLGDLGYRFASSDLQMRILSHTNYYPSLLQIYCKHLLQYLTEPGANRFDSRESPPYEITERHLDRVQNDELRTKILDKFRLTLDLDPRYRLIALCLAYANGESRDLDIDRQGVDPQWVRSQAMRWWPVGFAHDSSLEAFKNILDEMIGLGILRRIGPSRFALRSPNLANLLGSSTEVDEHLIDASDRPAPTPYVQGEFRRSNRTMPFIRSPYTAQQEAALLESVSGVAVVFGTPLTGMQRATEFLEILSPTVHIERDIRDARAFGRFLSDRTRTRHDGTALIVVAAECPWGDRWVDQAVTWTRQRQRRLGTVRVIFLADGRGAWSWITNGKQRERLVDNGVIEISLRPWSDEALKHWLEERELPLTDRERQMLANHTGYWSEPLWHFAQKCQVQPNEWRTHLAELGANDQGRLPKDAPIEVPSQAIRTFRCMAELGAPVTAEEVVQLVPEVELADATQAMEWGELVSYVRVGSGESRTLDPFVGALVAP